MAVLNEAARNALNAGRLAHLVTLNPDGGPQVSLVWVGVRGEEIVAAHLFAGKKLSNLERDPRVVLSMEAEGRNEFGLDHYIVVRGRAHLTKGGGPELLQELAHTYLGPDVKFPPMDDPPPGTVIHIIPERIWGVGPWTD